MIYCQHHWGSGKAETNLDPEYMVKRAKMVAKYANPLPEGWKEMYDPGTGRHFYWCMRTERVSWLPPGHPKAKVRKKEISCLSFKWCLCIISTPAICFGPCN